MRPLYLLLPFSTWFSIGLADAAGLDAVVERLPRCAQSCLATAIFQSPCQITDTTCTCTNVALQEAAEACLLQSCTVRESLTTKNLTTTLCNAPFRSTGEEIRISNIVLGVITATFALSRFVYKAFFSIGDLGWDDYSVIAALVVGVPSTVMIDRGIVPNGLGLDVWTVPFDHITEFARYLYVLAALYCLQLALVKLTLLLFFLRIFPKPLIRRLVWITIIFTGLWGLVFTITAFFQCQPISYYWTSWDKEGTGKCVNINAFAWTNAVISIVLDIWMLLLPLHEVFKLHLNWSKKISVSSMFFVATFVTIVSCLRLQSLVHFAASENPTWDQTAIIKWSNIEINVGIMCACMPDLRVIAVHMFPRMLRSTKELSASYYGHGSRVSGNTTAGRTGLIRNKSATNEPIAITCTKSFTVQHGENDETSLVHMDEFGSKTPKTRSINASEMSV